MLHIYIFELNKYLSNSGTKASWTEEQEDELRHLFLENQNNPETDQGKHFFYSSTSLFFAILVTSGGSFLDERKLN